MIRSFRHRDTEKLFRRERGRAVPPALAPLALRKLLLLDAAGTLHDLRVPPGNRVERLPGDREGRYSLAIEPPYRICFTWSESAAHDVEIVSDAETN